MCALYMTTVSTLFCSQFETDRKQPYVPCREILLIYTHKAQHGPNLHIMMTAFSLNRGGSSHGILLSSFQYTFIKGHSKKSYFSKLLKNGIISLVFLLATAEKFRSSYYIFIHLSFSLYAI